MDDDTVTSVNTSVCAKCGRPAQTFCPRCGQDFCDVHQCIMHSSAFMTESTPLVDDEGVTHKGRHIRLIGEGWPMQMRRISGTKSDGTPEMTDEELVQWLGEMKQLLAECVKAGDYARICIAHAEYDLGYREHSRYVAAVKRREKIEQGAVRLNGKKHKVGEIPPDIASLMKAFNLSQEDAIKLKSVLSMGKK